MSTNNKAIQILRTNAITDTNKGTELLKGQPFYNAQKNYLTIGHENNGTVDQKPITVREMVGYFDDNNNDNKITSNMSNGYSISPSTTGNKINVTSSGGMNVTNSVSISNSEYESAVKLEYDDENKELKFIFN